MSAGGSPGAGPAWQSILESYRMDEAAAVDAARRRSALSPEHRQTIAATAHRLVDAVRARTHGSLRAEAFLQHYDLSTHEGVVLMCLAEALLRIPDDATVDALIRDKLSGARWESAAGSPPLMNAASWALMLTGRLAAWQGGQDRPETVLRRLVARVGEPVVRAALRHAVGIMAGQFVSGETIGEALALARREPRLRRSYDMLGESARTARDAARYFDAYLQALREIAAHGGGGARLEDRAGLSIKLSALHPRYEMAQRERVLRELLPRLVALCIEARDAGLPVTIDAEEADRLLLSLELFARLAQAPELRGWEGLGLAVQAYQKRALAVCDWLADIAERTGRRIMVRLVKGAYWDTEIKLAQMLGLDYPVYTRKAATDVAYMACANALLAARGRIYPQFATHNCHTVAFVLHAVGERRDYEFQKLHGMGDALYEALLGESDVACRVYAPVGVHRDLLAYLVRRILENGANTSFVHRVTDPRVPVDRLVADPVELLPQPYRPHPRLPPPRELYADRLNARGVDLSDPRVLARLEARIADDRAREPKPVSEAQRVDEPADRGRVAGYARGSDAADVSEAVRAAGQAWRAWDRAGARVRSDVLDRAAERIEEDGDALLSLLVREGGKCLPDAVSEVREAADLLRYYASRARLEFAVPEALPAPVGESNVLELAGRGVFACISPWNFPLAIFLGQIGAALAAGNAVVAKPAEQTPLVALRAVELLHRAGVPREVLHVVIGDGPAVGTPLIRHSGIDGVAFTGAFETAQVIQRELAARDGPIVPFVAETGGLNAMVADSTALPEQVVADVLGSAFNSAGQRCSALRVLLVQEEAAPRLIDMLAGAMAELRVGDPARADTDVGPVIDAGARTQLLEHIERLESLGKRIAAATCTEECDRGTFVAPCAYEVPLAHVPQREVFGPVLHVVRYPADRLETALAAIADTRYGLTLGIQSRIDALVERVRRCLPVGNTYVNRNMIGAVVGVQPFGGEGYSGTGPKAGGPRYLHRYAVERTLTVNTAAIGGTPDLVTGDW